MLEGLYIFFIGWHYVHLISVEHIVQIVASFYLVPDNSALKFDVFLGINKNFKVQELGKLRVIEHKNTLYNHHRCRSKFKDFSLFVGIIESIFLSEDRLSLT